MNLIRPTQADFREAPWRDAFLYAVEDYLHRSQEEISLQEEFIILRRALEGAPELLLLVALDEADHLLGWALARYHDQGTVVSGTMVFLWQVWINPLRARLSQMYREVFPIIQVWAQSKGASRFMVMTARTERAYDRIMERMGFKPYARWYSREVAKDGVTV